MYLYYMLGERTAALSGLYTRLCRAFLVIDRIAKEIIRLVASVCERVCVHPFVGGHSPV